MTAKKLIQCMMLVSLMPFCSIVMANENTPEEEKVIELTNQNNNGTNNETLKVPVTATCNASC